MYGQATQAWLMPPTNWIAPSPPPPSRLSLSPDDPDLLIDRAIAAGDLDRYADAVDDLDRALELDPRRADALALRAAGWRHVGDMTSAPRTMSTAALAIDPDQPEALLERGILRQRHNDRAGARRDWQRAVDLAPDSATADLAQQNLALLEAGPDAR